MPTVTFNTISELIDYVNNYIKENHREEITGPIHNNVENGIITYVKKATLNFFKADIVSAGGDVALADNITVVITNTPDSLTWDDNFGNEWIIVNTTGEIPLDGVVYYDPALNARGTIPANTVLHIVKAENDLWIQIDGGTGSSGSIQKRPRTFKVGVTAGAPAALTNTWTNSQFENSYVVLILSRSIFIDMEDIGEGAPYLEKALGSDTLTVQNYTFNDGDILSYILITP